MHSCLRLLVFFPLFIFFLSCSSDQPTSQKKEKHTVPTSSIPVTVHSAIPPSKKSRKRNIPKLDSIEQMKQNWADFIQHHPYSNRDTNILNRIKDIPKTDRPDLAAEQNFLMTMDPALKRVPTERLLIADERIKQYFNVNTTEETYAAISGVTWKERGPNNVGGRSRVAMFDLNDPTKKKVWAGGVNGGLWYTTDITAASPAWVHVDGFWDNIAISSMAIHPTNPNIMYVGTGEGWFNEDYAEGGGIWKTTDGGTTWNRLASTIPYINSSTANSLYGPFAFVNKIVVKSDGTVFAATRSNYINLGGLYRSTDGGAAWEKVLSYYDGTGSKYDRAADIELASNGDLFVSFGIYAQGAIFKSTNASNGATGTWTDLSPNIVIGTGQRIELACAPSNSNIVYAVASKADAGNSDVSWIKKTIDGGTTWTTLTIPTLGATEHFTRGQAWYDLILAVHPTNPDMVIAGGIDLHRTTNGGSSWTALSGWSRVNELAYVHADQHAVQFRPDYPNEIIIGNDGGIYYSQNGGNAAATPSFASKNTGYNVTQLYSVSGKNEASANYFLTGAQDNGSLLFKNPGKSDAFEILGGDGSFAHIDQNEPNNQIMSYTYNVIYLSKDGGLNFTDAPDNNGTSGLFINPSAYDNTANILYCASNDNTLRRISGIGGTPTNTNLTITEFSNGKISTLKVSPYTDNVLFVGLNNGRIYKINNANTTPTATRIDVGITASGWLSCIDIGADDNQLMVTFSNYGVTSVWQTTDGGTSWSSKEGDLPDFPVRWGLYNPNNRNQVVLATELGIWTTDNFNNANPVWGPSSTGLARTRCDMLYYRSADRMVAVATHGRGLFTSDIFATTSVADFSSAQTVSCTGTLTTSFSDGSILPNSSWAWDIDNNGSTDYTTQNPTHTYNTPGYYSVKLSVNSGTAVTTKTQHVLVMNTAPTCTACSISANANYHNGAEVGISRFKLHTIDNYSLNSDGAYHDYSCSMATTLLPNTTYSVTIKTGTYNSEGAKVFLDYNGDGDFADAGEDIATFTASTEGGRTLNFTTPLSGITFNKGLRLRVLSKFAGVPVSATDVGLYGQAEDYTVYFYSEVLPVQFIAFSVNCINKGVQVMWKTATESNSSHFDIQRNTEGDVWETIGRVTAKGNSTTVQQYVFTDTKPTGGKTFYRLHQVDRDGRATYSDIVFVSCENKATVNVYPNPAKDFIQLSNLKKGTELSILSIQGMQIRKIKADQPGIRIPVTDLSSGTYLIQWMENGTIESRTFIIQR